MGPSLIKAKSTVMKLHEIIKRKSELGAEHGKLHKEYETAMGKIKSEVQELERLETAAMNDLNIDYIQIAESVMYVRGNPYGVTDDVSKFGSSKIAFKAINDIATGCSHLKKEFYGNKTYSGYYQGCDCNYGYGPNHGSICDEIGLRDSARKRELTSDEKDACIYYLRNYEKIKALVKVPA
jgi:hypothetical protein